MQTLRDELLTTQSARTGLTKWKFLLIGGLGAAAAGAGGLDLSFDNRALLILISPVCLYVDALYFHYAWRIKEIGRFCCIYRPNPEWQYLFCYEKWIRMPGFPKPFRFRLETVCITGASFFVSGWLVFLALFVMTDLDSAYRVSIGVVAVACAIMTQTVRRGYTRRLATLNSLGEESLPAGCAHVERANQLSQPGGRQGDTSQGTSPK